jgi:hypothetical protein
MIPTETDSRGPLGRAGLPVSALCSPRLLFWFLYGQYRAWNS